MKSCIISLATYDKQYPAGLARLEQSVRRVKFKGHFVSWLGAYPPGCPAHSDVPFAFKPFCFMEAKKRGYELILWIDSSGVAISPLDPLFREIEKEGHVLIRNKTFILGEWCSDEALNALDITRNEALKMAEINAAVIGLNMRSQRAVAFLNRWHEKATDGVSFKGTRDNISYFDFKWNKNQVASKCSRVRGHRHDQTVAGVIANRFGMKLSSAGIIGVVPCKSNSYLSPLTTIVINRDVAQMGVLMSVNDIYIYSYISRLKYGCNRLKELVRTLIARLRHPNASF
jgi:hypothetical protein